MNGFGAPGGSVAGNNNFGGTFAQQSGFGGNTGGFGMNTAAAGAGFGSMQNSAGPIIQGHQGSGEQGRFGDGAFGGSTFAGGGFGFGSATTTSAPAAGGFGSAAHTSAPAAGGFGSATNTSAPAVGGFGSAAHTSAPAAGGFGSATHTSAPAAGGFGSAAHTSTPAVGGFGSATTTSAPAAGGFGSATTTSTPAVGGFGSATTTSAPAAGGFGSATTTSAPAAGGFGSATTTSAPAVGGNLGNSAAAATSGTAMGTCKSAAAELKGKALFSILAQFDKDFAKDYREFQKLSQHMLFRDRQIIDRGNEILAYISHLDAAISSAEASKQRLSELKSKQGAIAAMMQRVEDAVQPIYAKVRPNFTKLDEQREATYTAVINLFDEVEAFRLRLSQSVAQHNRSLRQLRECDDLERMAGLVDCQLSALERCSKRAEELESEMDLLLGKNSAM
ncbi:hypothetical protein ECC02_009011 [Trypanosoma cruzi]|uniref:Nucleoporin NSP1-like C-terminal domain-containing protein n=1 Tax=Trypanosoma cruzi TaxID=5693 RepID=A0A7J6XVQ6_TRYCR|nr:hypothetical protein ECC02_009011 [Trypanosoma cruzi]